MGWRMIAGAALLLLTACGSASPPASSPPLTSLPASPGVSDPLAIGRAFIEAVSRGDTAAAETMEDAAMRAAAPAATLQSGWQSLIDTYGAFSGFGEATVAAQPPYTEVRIPASFANADVTVTVVITTATGEVAGLSIAEAGAASPGVSSPPASYVDPASFIERDITVGSEPWALPGTLSVPVGDGPFPGVVLVAGSGPVDRDEAAGPNAPLRDLAWGLASQGIAVMRYDKRTFVYPAAAQSPDFTVQAETMDDAAAAVVELRETPGVDPGRVFLIGHSLGAYLAPRIAVGLPGAVRGIALLEAPSTRSQPRLMLAQATYVVSLRGSPDRTARDELASLEAKVALAESPSLALDTPPSELPLGLPAAYWLDLRDYDQLATAAALNLPIFVAQGGRDFQVPPEELGGWEEALAGRTDVRFERYPALDHRLIAGSGPGSPDDYAIAGHVDAQLVADLVAWIAGH